MKTFWLKELPERKLFLPNGAPVPFTNVTPEYGLLSTDDGYIIAELEKAVRGRIGGVIKLTEEEFDSWKKKVSAAGLPLNSTRERESLGPIPQADLQRLKQQGLAAVVGPVGNPPSVGMGSPWQIAQQAGMQKVQPLDTQQEFKVPGALKRPRVAKITPAPKPGPEPSLPPP